MNNFWKYLLIFLGVLLVVFVIALPLFGMGFGMMGGYGPGGFYRMPMMYGMRGFGGFGIFRLALVCLIPLVVLGLIVAGVVALVRRPSQPLPPTPPPATPPAAPSQPTAVQTRVCPNCGRVVEAGWVACPYCGAPLNEPPQPPAETA